MKVSIVTPAYNSADTIEDTLESVGSQSHEDIEHIVMDGGSSDGTQEIVRRYNHARLVSQPDDGIYDAMNKGVEASAGEVVGILNSDDFYATDAAIGKVVEKFKETKADTCYGDLKYVDPENTERIVREWRAGSYKKSKLKYGWAPPHPTFFVRKEVYIKCGVFDLDFPIAADYELMLRFLRKCNVSVAYIPETLTYMRTGGNSGESLSKRIAGWKELRQAWHKHNLDVPWYFSITRPLFKVGQFLK